mmetsp:Transcript_87169/g.251402  ORF Transcript_87169/g.251402 Transcript_87169/m.251402 type:complete len:259 (+) Transcript_87169:186-962(+)
MGHPEARQEHELWRREASAGHQAGRRRVHRRRRGRPPDHDDEIPRGRRRPGAADSGRRADDLHPDLARPGGALGGPRREGPARALADEVAGRRHDGRRVDVLQRPPCAPPLCARGRPPRLRTGRRVAYVVALAIAVGGLLRGRGKGGGLPVGAARLLGHLVVGTSRRRRRRPHGRERCELAHAEACEEHGLRRRAAHTEDLHGWERGGDRFGGACQSDRHEVLHWRGGAGDAGLGRRQGARASHLARGATSACHHQAR